MNILLIGASGDIGRAVSNELGSRHTVIAAGRKAKPPHVVDLTDSLSIDKLIELNHGVDALIVAAGETHFGALEQMTVAQFRRGLEGKMLGQIEIALLAQHHVADDGSITLTSGLIGEDSIRYGACASAVNGAIENFVRAAACELKRGIRINVVSPGPLDVSVDRIGRFFYGFDPVSSERVARAYARSAEGIETGKIYRVR